jgi:hypothetical protein
MICVTCTSAENVREYQITAQQEEGVVIDRVPYCPNCIPKVDGIKILEVEMV